MVIRHLKQNGKVKKLDKCVPHKLTANQKKKLIWSVCLLLLYTATISQPDCDMWQKVDFIQLVKTSSVGGPRSSFKAHPKPNLHQKNVMVTVWQSAASMIHYSYLNSGETITSEKYTKQIGEVHWTVPQWSTERAQLFMTTPSCMSHNQCFKNWMNWATKFCPLCHIHPTSCQPSFFMHLNSFLQGKRFHNQEKAENAFQEFIESWSMDFYATGMNKLIFHWQKCADCNGFYFD